MKRLFTLIAMMAAVVAVNAQKQLYIPWEWRNSTATYRENDPDNQAQYSKSRSKESENFIVYWEKGYGNTIPTNAPTTYRVDIDDLLEKAEWFYSLNVGKLGFCDESNSNVKKYKMIICLLHDDGWVATGSGYDNVIGALWVTPSTCKPVGHTIAHEIGHSFQYQCFCDLGGYAGFRTAIGNGSTFWEQTAQWQAAQAYPDQLWNESWIPYGTPFFPRTYNYAMTHEHMRYQSYWWHYYLVDRYGIDFIGKLWRHDAGKGVDPNEVLMHMMNWSSDDLYKAYFDYAMHMATTDFEGLRENGLEWINFVPYTYNYVTLGGTKHQVAYSSCPQATGFNVIPLNVPEAGQTITTDFTSLKANARLAEGDPIEYHNGDTYVHLENKAFYNNNSKYNAHRGFRLGYVALLNDGTRQYLYEDSLYCADDNKAGSKTVSVSATVPENTQKLWFIVSPAPREYYQHKWNEKPEDDDQWPYTVEFQGTNISGAPIIDENLPITDATITYDVAIPRANTYGGTSITLDGTAAAALGTAFQMQPSEVSNHLVNWTSAAPADGQIKFYAVNPTTGDIVNAGSTANGHGHWFNADGARCEYADANASVYSEFAPATLTFNIGQYPNRLTSGKEYTISQALRYHRGDQTATVRIVFRVKCNPAGTRATASLASVQQSEVVTGIDAPRPVCGDTVATNGTGSRYFTPAGTPIPAPQRGLNIVRTADGRTQKVFLK